MSTESGILRLRRLSLLRVGYRTLERASADAMLALECRLLFYKSMRVWGFM